MIEAHYKRPVALSRKVPVAVSYFHAWLLPALLSWSWPPPPKPEEAGGDEEEVNDGRELFPRAARARGQI